MWRHSWGKELVSTPSLPGSLRESHRTLLVLSRVRFILDVANLSRAGREASRP